jgi:hypothetical protein
MKSAINALGAGAEISSGKGGAMPEQSAQDTQQLKIILRSSIAAAAPAVVVFTVLITSNAVGLLQTWHMGRLGMLAAGILAIGLGFLLWRGRWWAGLPTMAAAGLAALYFAYMFARPMAAYLSANDFRDIFQAIIVLSPQLVLAVLCAGLFMLISKGVRLVKNMAPRPVGNKARILLGIWLVVLAGDLIYQQAGWQLIKSPSDLMVRLCQEQNHDQARSLLLQQGVKAVPSLLEGMAAKDKGLECLRHGSLEVLTAMGAAAVEPLLAAAKDENVQAVIALKAINDPRAAGPLMEIYRNPNPKGDPEFKLQLRRAIKKLNPSLSVDG